MYTPNKIIDKYLGIEYINNGRDPKYGLDCWGVVLTVTKDIFNTILPDANYSKFSLFRHKEDIIRNHNIAHWVDPVTDQPRFGDFILINAIENLPIHVGIYMKDGKFLHSMSNTGVVLSELTTWKSQVEGIYRLKDKYIQND